MKRALKSVVPKWQQPIGYSTFIQGKVLSDIKNNPRKCHPIVEPSSLWSNTTLHIHLRHSLSGTQPPFSRSQAKMRHKPLCFEVISQSLLSTLWGQEQIPSFHKLDIRGHLPLDPKVLCQFFDEADRMQGHLDVAPDRELLTDGANRSHGGGSRVLQCGGACRCGVCMWWVWVQMHTHVCTCAMHKNGVHV